MKRLVCVAAALLVPIAAAAAWWSFTSPHIYRHVSAPDGSWQVTVLRQRVPPYVEGVDVIVRAEDAGGRLLHEQKIDSRDLWLDVDERYPVVEMDNHQFRAGPEWRNGQYFILDKASL